jgi:RNA polymerase sigma-70 factor (ECF subfamily)
VEDRELLGRAQRGDKEAFAEIVRRYHRSIYNLAYRMTGNREDSKDIVQEALLRAYRALPTFDLEKPFLPWVYRIAWNICADRGRKMGRTPQEGSLDDNERESASLAAQDPGPAKIYEAKETREALDDAINRLADGYRELIIMFHVDGLSIKEISEVTGMKETVIKNRLYRGRQRLRKILESGGTTCGA